MLGPSFEAACLELNASDARGIEVVRNKIKMFAQKKVTLPVGKHKIIILDEADSMTSSAQQALRRTMELYSSTTRFALACNISSKIIEPIQSRCAILRFSKLTDDQVLDRMIHVIRSEGITQYTNDGLEALIFTAGGDLRNAINNLQSTYAGLGSITAENVFKIVDQPHPITVQQILEFAIENDLENSLLECEGLFMQGYASVDIINTFFKVCKNINITPRFSDERKLQFIKEISLTHMRIADGANSLLQLTGLIGRLCMLTAKA